MPVIPVVGIHHDERLLDLLQSVFSQRPFLLGTRRGRSDFGLFGQAPFKYQAKCLGWLRDADGALDVASRGAVDGILSGTGCDRLPA